MFQKCEAFAFSLTLTLSPPSHANYCSAPHISDLTSCMLPFHFHHDPRGWHYAYCAIVSLCQHGALQTTW
jgi:hypothetical protein